MNEVDYFSDMRILSLFIFLAFHSFLLAQESADSITTQDKKGFVRFLVDVDNGYFEIVIDDTIYKKIYKSELAVGHHKAKVWSPGYVTNLVEFDIEEGKTVDVYVKMAISNERQEYEREYRDYRMKFHKSLTVPLSATLATAVVSTSFMISAYTLRKKIYNDIDLYFSAPTYSEVQLYKQNIAENNRKYNRQRIIFYSGLGLTLAGIGTTIYTYHMFKKDNTEPQLKSESPFRDKFSYYITPFGGGIKWRFG